MSESGGVWGPQIRQDTCKCSEIPARFSALALVPSRTRAYDITKQKPEITLAKHEQQTRTYTMPGDAVEGQLS